MSTNDTALLQRWTRHRDADAFAELVARHGGMVYGACRRVLGDAHEAQDAAQESFMELMRARHAITTSLPGWLHTVAVRRSLDRIKKSQRRRLREESFAANAEAAVEIAPDDLLTVVDEAIAAQPETYRAPIVLRFLEGQTHAEIGAQLGIAESTVRHRIEKGVEQVRETLRKRGVLVGAGILTAALERQSAQAAPSTLVAALGRTAVSGAVPAAVAGVFGAGFWGVLTKAVAVILVAGAIGVAIWTAQGPGNEYAKQAASTNAGSAQTGAAPQTPRVSPPAEDTGGSADGPSTASASASSASVPAVAAAGEEQSPPAVSGRVYDMDSGAGIPGVRVMIWNPASGTSDRESETSDADGHYTIRDLTPGRYRFTPRAGKLYPGTQYGLGTEVTIEAGKPVTNLDFALKRGIRVAGRVVDAAGETVEKATVLARTKEYPNPGSSETDANGAFDVYLEAPSNDLYVRAYTDGMLGETLEGLSLPAAGVDGITITLNIPRTASVSGTAIDAQGRPARDLVLHLRAPESPFFPPVSAEYKTAANGTFTVAGLVPGSYELGLTPPGVTGWSTGDVAATFELSTGQQLRGLRLVYGEKGGLAISGIVVDTSGKPISGVRVSAYGPKNETAHTDKNGRFLITGLEEGAYHLNTDHMEYTFGGKAGVAAGTADVEIVLQGKGAIRGRVTDAKSGKPIPAFEVCFINGAHDAFKPELLQNARAFQDTSGAFEITGVYAGPVTVTARADGYAASFQAVTVVEHDAVEVDLALEQAVPVIGKVVDPGGNPVRDAFVFLPGIGVSMLFVKQQALSQTDANGAFRIDFLPFGINAIAAYAPPFGPAIAPLTDYSQPVMLTLPEPGVLEGRIVAPGQDHSRAGVHARYKDRPDFVYFHTNLDETGGFRLTGLAPGEMDVQASLGTTGRSARSTAIVVSGQTTSLDLVFEDGTAAVSGRVTVGENPPDASSACLEVAAASGTQGYQAHADADGCYRFEGIAAGAATLKVYIAPKENPVAAETREIAFDIAPGDVIAQDISF